MELIENKIKYTPPPHAQKKSFRSSPVGKTYDAEDVSKKAKTSTDQYKHTKDPKPEGGCQIFYSADFFCQFFAYNLAESKQFSTFFQTPSQQEI